MKDLEARIQRLEDLEAIKQLRARYCEICDDDDSPALITTIFTEDGIWEGKGIGKARGHDEIRKLFEGFRSAMSYSQHMVLNPIIDVDGDTATGRWYYFGAIKYIRNNQAGWQAVRYHDVYRKVDGCWKIAHLKIAPPIRNVKYEDGW